MRWSATCLVLLCLCGLARADVFAPLPPLGRYEARTLVTGTDMRSRPAGMAACLADVLAKVSGDAAIVDDPRLAHVDAGSLAADWDYVDRMGGLPHRDEQGSSDRPFWLTVRFRPAAVDAVLDRLGRAAFTGTRPSIVPLVVVVPPAGPFLVLPGQSRARDHIAALGAAADRVGLPLAMPNGEALARGDRAPAGAQALLGVLTWSDTAHGWVAVWHGAGRDWSVAGVSFDEAYRVGLRGMLGILAGHPPS